MSIQSMPVVAFTSYHIHAFVSAALKPFQPLEILL